MLPFVGALAAILLGVGFYWSLFVAPPDYQQGDAFRIIYVHVPAAWMSLFVYGSWRSPCVGFIFNHPLGDVAAKAAAPSGAVFTALALVTGMLWGKPMWGTWWVWDGRLTSELILLFIYFAYIALWDAIEEPTRASMARILCLVGAVDRPIIHFSVDGGAGRRCTRRPAYALWRLKNGTASSLAAWHHGAGIYCPFPGAMLVRMRTEILERRARTLMLARSAA